MSGDEEQVKQLTNEEKTKIENEMLKEKINTTPNVYELDKKRLAELQTSLHEILHLQERNQKEVIEPIDNIDDQEKLQTLLRDITKKTVTKEFGRAVKHFSFGVVNGIILGILVTFSLMFILSYFGRFNVFSNFIAWMKKYSVIGFYKINKYPLPEDFIAPETFFNVMVTTFFVLWAFLLVLNIYDYSGTKTVVKIGNIAFKPFSFPGLSDIPILGSALSATVIWLIVFAIINFIGWIIISRQPKQGPAGPPVYTNDEIAILDAIITSMYLTDFNETESSLKKEATELKSVTDITQDARNKVQELNTKYSAYLDSKTLIDKLMDEIINSAELKQDQAYDKQLFDKATKIKSATPLQPAESKTLYGRYKTRVTPIEPFRNTPTLQKIRENFSRSRNIFGY